METTELFLRFVSDCFAFILNHLPSFLLFNTQTIVAVKYDCKALLRIRQACCTDKEGKSIGKHRWTAAFMKAKT